MVSVKTESPVPKERMLEAIALLRKLQLNSPVKIGDVALSDITGTYVVVTKSVN